MIQHKPFSALHTIQFQVLFAYEQKEHKFCTLSETICAWLWAHTLLTNVTYRTH